jgi:hypothetical protein
MYPILINPKFSENKFIMLNDNRIEKYPLERIEGNIDKLYIYLSSKSYKTPSDAVPFIGIE